MKTPMLMQPKLKIYAALLIASIALMVALGRCSRQYASKEAQSSGGDTIDVAIEYSPLSLYMYAATRGFMDAVPVASVPAFERDFLDFIRSAKSDILDDIVARKVLDADLEARLKDAILEFKKGYNA